MYNRVWKKRVCVMGVAGVGAMRPEGTGQRERSVKGRRHTSCKAKRV